MELLPMRLQFDSPQSFSQWLASALPTCRHEVVGGAVRVASSDLSSVLIKPASPGQVAIEYENPRGSAASIITLVQLVVIVWTLWMLMKGGRYPGLIERHDGVDSFSKSAAMWWTLALGFVAFMAWLPGAIFRHFGAAGARPVRDAIAALLQGNPPPGPIGKGTGVGVALLVALFAVLFVGSSVNTMFMIGGAASAENGSGYVAPRPAEEPWRTENGPDWTISIPSSWARSEEGGVTAFNSVSTDAPNPVMTRLSSAAVPPEATMDNVRSLIGRRVARMGRTVTQREVTENGVTWLEVEWVSADQTPLHGLRRGGLAAGRVWEFECAGADVLFDQVRPVCARLFSSLRVAIVTPTHP